MPTKGKRAAFLIAALAIAALLSFCFAFRDSIAKQWYIYRLQSSNEETRLLSANALCRGCSFGITLPGPRVPAGRQGKPGPSGLAAHGANRIDARFLWSPSEVFGS